MNLQAKSGVLGYCTSYKRGITKRGYYSIFTKQKDQVTRKKSKGIIRPKLGSDFQSPPHQLSKKQKLNTPNPAAVNEEMEIKQHGEDLSDFPFEFFIQIYN